MNFIQMFLGAVLLTFGVALGAGQKPNFSGTWIVISPAEAAGQEHTVKQDKETFSMGHASEGGGHSFTYKLDGSETRNVLRPHPAEEIVLLATAAWKGNQLVINERTMYPDGREVTSTRVFMLDDRQQLVIEGTEESAGKPAAKYKLLLRRKR